MESRLLCFYHVHQIGQAVPSRLQFEQSVERVVYFSGTGPIMRKPTDKAMSSAFLCLPLGFINMTTVMSTVLQICLYLPVHCNLPGSYRHQRPPILHDSHDCLNLPYP
jgi:hypothetical protein